MDYESIKTHFKIKQDHGDSCKAVCPAHPDKEASLSISYDKAQGKTIIYCHAGCDIREILDNVGLKMTDLFDREMSKNKNSNIEKVYKYTDKTGEMLFEKVRFKGKKFSQRRTVEAATVWGLEKGTYYETFNGSNAYSTKKRDTNKKEFEGIEPVLYNLPAVIEAVKNGQPILFVEGEKDADNVNSIGLIATTTFDGASASKKKSKWRESYNQYLKGAKVIILHDNDEPGRAHAKDIAKNIAAITESIKIIDLPDLDIKEDVSDWLSCGGTKDKLLDLVENAEKYDPNLEPEEINLINYNFSDVGNAERLIAMYNKIIRYNPVRKKWFIWSGKHWNMDCTGRIEVLARKVIKTLQLQGIMLDDGLAENIDLRKQIQKFVLKSEADNRIKAMINQSRTEHNIILMNMNKNVYLLNLKNGTLNLKTGELQEHNRKDYITRLVNVEYNPGAECPNWKEFIDKIFMGNDELIDYIQKSIGYSMTGDSNLQCFYICHGAGSNGKGTFMKAIMTILGDYAAVLKGNSLMEKMGDEGARGDLAKLEGKYFVCVNELEEGKCFDEALVKSLSSGADEAIPVRRMYEEEFDLHPTFKMWMTTNKLPKIKGTDNGIWRRVRKIPFEYSFENDKEKDEHFFENKLVPEMSGILNWALEGCLKWQKEGMKIPEVVKYAVDEYKSDMDPVQRFLDDECILSETCKTKISQLYDAYEDWCHENKEYVLSSIKLSKKVAEKGFKKTRDMNGRYWMGIGIVDNDHEEITEVQDNMFPFRNV